MNPSARLSPMLRPEDSPAPIARSPHDRLVVRDLTVAYQQRVVLSGVSADIRRGQVVGVIGPNGGGKSTFLKAVLGIAPIVNGEITLFGRPAREMRSLMAYVPQREAVEWDFPVTVHDVAMMGRYPRAGWIRRPGRHDREVVEAKLERMGISDLRRAQIGQLSGGQQQRVFIARALAQEAEVLLLDEPMNAVDAATQDVILQVIEEQRAADKIILLATHDLVSGPVIILGRPDMAEPLLAHHLGEAAHHQHVHEPLGEEHD
jgi:manganese/zinc/iron transport system ATP- binding protein